MFKNIVVAVDGSAQAEKAMNVACDIAKNNNSSLYLVHSPQVDTAGIAVGSGAVEIQPSEEEIQEAGKQVMAKAVKQANQLGCATVNSLISNKEPAKMILEQAEKLHADLIVTGKRGLGRLTKMVLGSVSQEVSNNASCACLSVK